MRRILSLLIVPLFVALVGFAVGYHPTSLAAGPPNRGLDFYAELVARAAGGDAAAADAVAQLRGLAESRGVTPEELILAGGELAERADQPIPAAAQGVTPFFIRIDAVAGLETADDLQAYVDARRAALAELVEVDGGGPITVSLGFSERPLLGPMLDLVRTHNGQVEQVLLDASLDGRRLFTAVMAKEEAAALAQVSNAEALAHLVTLVEEMQQPLCGASAANIEWLVRATRVSVTAADAAEMAREPAVLLVDPMDDVLAGYRARAAEVNVGAWPNVTIASEELDGDVAPDAICEEGS